jgi:hypothetical protein
MAKKVTKKTTTTKTKAKKGKKVIKKGKNVCEFC